MKKIYYPVYILILLVLLTNVAASKPPKRYNRVDFNRYVEAGDCVWVNIPGENSIYGPIFKVFYIHEDKFGKIFSGALIKLPEKEVPFFDTRETVSYINGGSSDSSFVGFSSSEFEKIADNHYGDTVELSSQGVFLNILHVTTGVCSLDN